METIDKNDPEDVNAAYRAGLRSIHGKFLTSTGINLNGEGMRNYTPVLPREREATPPEQDRSLSIDNAALPARVYFKVHFHDWHEAQFEYNLNQEPKSGSCWENTSANGINRQARHYYSEDPEIIRRALARWDRFDPQTGELSPPPQRHDPARGLGPRPPAGHER